LSLKNLYKAIEKIESGGDPDAISSKGARGLMQVMPSTARNPGYGITPVRNQSKAEYVRVGKDYAKAMYNKFGGNIDAVLAAYNMGPGATEKWIAGGKDKSKLPRETRNYIPKVKKELNRLDQRSFKMSKKDTIKKGAKNIKSASQRLKEIKEAKKLKAKNNIAKQLEEAKQKNAALEAANRKKIAKLLKTKSKTRVTNTSTPLKNLDPKAKADPKVKANQTKANQTKANQTKANQNKKTDTNKTKQTKANQTKANQTKANQNKTNQNKKTDTNKTKQTKKTDTNKTGPKTNNNKIMTAKNKLAVGTAIALPFAAAATRKNKKEKETVLSKKRDKDNRLPPGAFGGKVKPTKPKPTKPTKPKPTKPITPFGSGEAGTGNIPSILNKFVKTRGGWDKFGAGKFEKGMAKIGGGKARDAITAAEDSLYNELLSKKRSDDPNVTLTSAEKAHMKKVESRKKGGMVKRKYGGKIKRNMGGPAKPRKKTVFRRGGGQALRGFGKATYSNKMY